VAAFSIAWDFLVRKQDELPDLFSYENSGKKKKIDVGDLNPHQIWHDDKPELKPSSAENVGELLDESGQLKPSLQGNRQVGVKATQPIQPVQDEGKIQEAQQAIRAARNAQLAEQFGEGYKILGVAGSSNIDDTHSEWEILDMKMDEWIKENGMPDAIASKMVWAKTWANDNKIPVINNMDDATHLLAFPSMEGKKTQQAISAASEKGIPVHTHYAEWEADEPLQGPSNNNQDDNDWFGTFMGQESPGVFEDIGGRQKGEKFSEDKIESLRHASEEEGGAQRGLEHARRRRVGGAGRGNPMRMTPTANPRTRINEQGEQEQITGVARRADSSEEGIRMHEGLNRSTTRHLPKMTPYHKKLQEWKAELERLQDDSSVSPQWIDAHIANKPLPEDEKKRLKASEEAMEEGMAEIAGVKQRPKKQQFQGEGNISIHRGGRRGQNKPKPDDDEEDGLPDLFGYSEPMDVAFRLLKVF
jgi:type II secretory pathway pseudopilin PulG